MPFNFVKPSSVVIETNPSPKKKFPIIWIILGIMFLAFVIYFSYQESIKTDQNGKIIGISEVQQEKFRVDSLKLANCVQYALVALDAGWYERCDRKGKVFLLRGEVYKYGFTCEKNMIERYPKNYYEEYKLEFLPQFFGNIFECQVEEKRKLYHYPALPENLKRPENQRLILPIGNCKTQ